MYLNARKQDVTQRAIRQFFESSQDGVEVMEDGLKEIEFGEYLVDQGVVDRFQLFRALQMQDRVRGAKLGECAAALGYAPIGAIERLYTRYHALGTVVVSSPRRRNHGAHANVSRR